MTTQKIIDRTNITWKGMGSYEVKIEYRGKTYRCQSNNSLAWDRIHSDEDLGDRMKLDFYTKKGAWQAFYDECKRKNNI